MAKKIRVAVFVMAFLLCGVPLQAAFDIYVANGGSSSVQFRYRIYYSPSSPSGSYTNWSVSAHADTRILANLNLNAGGVVNVEVQRYESGTYVAYQTFSYTSPGNAPGITKVTIGTVYPVGQDPPKAKFKITGRVTNNFDRVLPIEIYTDNGLGWEQIGTAPAGSNLLNIERELAEYAGMKVRVRIGGVTVAAFQVPIEITGDITASFVELVFGNLGDHDGDGVPDDIAPPVVKPDVVPDVPQPEVPSPPPTGPPSPVAIPTPGAFPVVPVTDSARYNDVRAAVRDGITDSLNGGGDVELPGIEDVRESMDGSFDALNSGAGDLVEAINGLRDSIAGVVDKVKFPALPNLPRVFSKSWQMSFTIAGWPITFDLSPWAATLSWFRACCVFLIGLYVFWKTVKLIRSAIAGW